MNRLKSAAVVAAALVVFCWSVSAVNAQTTLPTRSSLLPTKNTREIGFAASWLFNGDQPYAVSGTYGVFTDPSLEVGLTGSVSGARHTRTFSSVGGFADYYFRGSESIENNAQLLPYLGVFAGYSHQDDSNASVGAQAGVKYFLNPNVALTGEVQYRSTRHGGGNTALLLGLSTFFR